MNIEKMTAIEIGKKIKNKEISSVEATKAILENIEKNEKNINAYTLLLKEEAIKKAEKVQEKIEKGELTSDLAGVPMAIKDNICTKNITTTCGSKMLQNFVPEYNATVVERLEKAGAIMIGKLNMDEFAMGSSNETSAFGAVKNPWDLERVSGGSSGGSVASVACGEAIYSLGSDTGGSIRQPAAFCGVTGFKPTYGAISRYGLIDLAPSLDQIGPIAKDIRDCAIIIEAISGYDKKDPTTVKHKFDFSNCFNQNIKGLKIGVPTNYFNSSLNDSIKTAVYEAIKIFEKIGATIEEFTLNLNEYSIPVYHSISCAEINYNLEKYGKINYNYQYNKEDLLEACINSRSECFGFEVKKRIMFGAFIRLSKNYDLYYKKALKVRRAIKNNFDELFNKYDLILTPSTTETAFKIGENISDSLKMYYQDIYTISSNIAGIPAVSIPCGFCEKGLPIGLQLIAKEFNESAIIKAGYAFQSVTDFHTKTPTYFVK